MKELLKISVSSLLLSFSFSSFAGNYVSIFKPNQKVKTLSDFKADIQKDVLQIRSLIDNEILETKLEQKKTIELVKYKTTNKKQPI